MKANIEKFIHLRTQSSYSMLESALSIESLVELAKSHRMPAIAMTDRGNLFGLLEFAIAASKAGLQPIHGAILNLLYLDASSTSSAAQFAEILLISKDYKGYANLLKLVSYTFTKNERLICNHITIQDLIDHQEGIIALSAYSEGVIGKLLLENNKEAAISFTQKFQEIFGDRFYFEIMRHDIEKERQIEGQYINIAIELNIPLVATNNVLFKDAGSHNEHDVLLCISAGVTKEYPHRKRASEQCYFKSSREMQKLFADIPEALSNTYYLAQRCHVMAETSPPMLPRFASDISSVTKVDTTEFYATQPYSPTNVSSAASDLNSDCLHLSDSSYNAEEALLRKLSHEGLNERLRVKFMCENTLQDEQEKIRAEYLVRLNYELDIICSMNFNGYFLIVSDFIKWSKKNNITVGPGRGSGAGSMVAWCLLITDLDPIKFGLLFERFLNPARVSMPDFDIDFCQERREEVINYVRTKYGENRVGQIITFGKLQAKAVIKDVSRVLTLPYKFAEKLTELVPFNAVNPVTLDQAIREVAELKQAASGKGLYELKGEEDLIKQVIKTALALEGLHRHASIHAAGIVIAGKDLVDIVPVYKDINSDMLVVQYSMKYAELAGLMKFDFLGLQTLTIITKCKELLKKQNIEINFDFTNFDDPKTYEMLAKGASAGVFQFESVGMKDTLRKLKPDCIEDLIALGALYRPGPMENIPTYIACKNGEKKPEYLHPLLKPILEETYGVIIYQEQVMEIAKILSGYSLAAADLLRRAMGKKIKAEMDAQEELFITGAKANGINQAQAKSIFTTVEKFAGYGFNKAHAAAYAVISYQTAYLKANFLAEFLTTYLNLELDNNDKINLFIQEAKINSIGVIAPNINKSYGHFTIENIAGKKSIIYAFGAIKTVTVNFGHAVETERNKNGPFKDITDFIERIPPKLINKRLLENLTKAGCFDEICDNPLKLLANIPKLIAYSNSYHQEQVSNQFSLISVKQVAAPFLLEDNGEDIETSEFDQFNVLGLFLSNHPLRKYHNIFMQFDIKNSLTLQQNFPKGSSQIKIAGIIQKKDARMSARGRFVTLQLSDPHGIFDLTIFSEEILRDYVHLLNIKTAVIATCEIYSDEGGIRLTAKSFSGVEEVIRSHNLKMNLLPKSQEELSQIIDLLAGCSNIKEGNIKITILLPYLKKNFMAKIVIPQGFDLPLQTLNLLEKFKQT